MINSFGSDDTERILKGERPKKLPMVICKVARRKLRQLNNAQILDDLRVPPGNRLEKLKGDLEDYYSIRINRQWRIIFIWDDGDVEDATIVDYH
jgi:proteic killer suppression protein